MRPSLHSLLKHGIRICIAGAALSLNGLSFAATAGSCTSWPAWEHFRQQFITKDGRVVDHSGNIKPTVSEGQAYAMFFAMAANDQPSFKQLLHWTSNNLAGGDLTVRLPAWQWGQRADQSWGVIDNNSASDADVWMAYSLLLAGDIWGNTSYSALGSLLAQRVLREESLDLPGLGFSLLPAPHGFDLGEKRWKLNPSYVPLQLLRWLAVKERDQRWQQMAQASFRLLIQSAPKGFSPDWTIYQTTSSGRASFSPDLNGVEKGDGGYNAIRVYLWAGMLHAQDPERSRLLRHLAPMAALTEQLGYPPEFVNIQTGEAKNPGTTGFSAALLPFLSSGQHSKALQQQQLRIQANGIRPDAYYDQVLALFGIGWQEKRFAFLPDGRAEFAWQAAACH
ncbi:cellulose synthase complex periplasmic endoglucanase BcsZ [Undibacterium curvum]|uniref:Glucanase n=1 Tax=Undibacterium curvum TaxID=2762294 RepID=A0ABR7A9R1_9BURK|nr:cellulose synthase complex periplasmic endoglucanase BcsZ [Undibacterium curvum]MBC3933648.1 cellulase [Undibacterium curvum]